MTPVSELTGSADAEVLALLAAALERTEAIPAHALELAYSARFMPSMEAVLADLVYDSYATAQPVMRRGTENEARFLSFTNENVTLDISLLADGHTIVGEIDPAVSRELVFEGIEGLSLPVLIDEFGRFRLTSQENSFRLRVTGHLVTQWITR